MDQQILLIQDELLFLLDKKPEIREDIMELTKVLRSAVYERRNTL